ncbi:putative G-protein coupled receptor 110 [Triplophysa rosa]|uniref:G-protein coupled receptor 110 n=1 Tax=Triplophysa rosa TaxID=992332 RepID=A0A9W7TPV3_TRIRA|nr:putative G-protein coupled receptor 110 [Triplophysa rosa]
MRNIQLACEWRVMSLFGNEPLFVNYTFIVFLKAIYSVYMHTCTCSKKDIFCVALPNNLVNFIYITIKYVHVRVRVFEHDVHTFVCTYKSICTTLNVQLTSPFTPPFRSTTVFAHSYTDYTVEIEINASSISVIDEIKKELEKIQIASPVANLTLLEANFTTVCSFFDTEYQCRCEAQHFWPCDMCKLYRSCNTSNDACSCIDNKPSGQFCQKTTNPACTQPPTDINECLNSSLVCGPNAYCHNSNGSYWCSCWSGYNATVPNLTISINNTCTDINECLNSSLVCGPNTYCHNSNGSFSCSCWSGYNVTKMNESVSSSNPCTDVNECQGNPSVCGPNSNCTNVNGGYNCSCWDGFTATVPNLTISINNTCTDINECLNSSLVCGPNTYCHNSNGSFSCSCWSGYNVTKMNESVSSSNPCTVYSTVTPPQTVSSTVTTPQTVYSTLTPPQRVYSTVAPPQAAIKMSMTIDKPFDTSLTKPEDSHYKDFAKQIQDAVEQSYKSLPSYKTGSVNVTGFSSNRHGTKRTSPGQKTQGLLQLLRTGWQVSTSVSNMMYSDVSWHLIKYLQTPDFTCQDNTLGFGKTNDMTKGLCENGKEGSITYKCKSNGWAIEQDDCVLKVIKDLESKLQGLAVTAIPQFMAELSNAVEQNNASVTQSAATVKTIVEILSNIADLSKNITHKKPVMESFLNTVDIIVSDNSSKTWNDLNNKNTTGNTSVKLLEAIENISDRLSDVFAINLSSIHLNRVTIKNSFNQTSQLPSSTTQIVIPNISKPTFITVIFFSKLNDVLPTRNTPNNDNRTSQNRINGDVVVVKVNETINNISFGFDITNSSLGNPQCVFWNFDLDRWDSTGCKVKITGNETDKVTCECIHTTSFSFLMSPFAITDPVKRTALAYITYIGVAISMASLVLCLIIEIILWKSVTRNDTSYMRHVSIVNIAVSLLIANFCFIIGAAIADQDIKQEQMISVGRCSAVVFFMHFFYLAFFFWMLVSALLLFYSTVIVFGQMSRTEMMVIAFTVGYGAPLLIAVITVAFTAGPKNYVSKENACWLNWNPSRALLAFVIPALTIVFINLVVLIVVVCKILKRGVGAVTRPGERHILIVIARCVAFLTPIFGLTWGFGIGTMVSRDFSLHVVFALLNSLQGVFVLVFGILLDGKLMGKPLVLNHIKYILTHNQQIFN